MLVGKGLRTCSRKAIKPWCVPMAAVSCELDRAVEANLWGEGPRAHKACRSLTWRVDASHCLQQSEAFRALATANLLAIFHDSFALSQKSVMRSKVWSNVDLATRSLHCYYRLLSIDRHITSATAPRRCFY